MSNTITGFSRRSVISESAEYTLTVSTYTSRERKNAPLKRFFVTKIYATGREEGVGFDADEFRALLASVASEL